MFEIKTNFHIEDYVGEYVTYSLKLENKTFDDVIVKKWENEALFDVSTQDTTATEDLLEYSLYEFPENVELNLFCGKRGNFTLYLQFKAPSIQPDFWENIDKRRLNVDIDLIPNLANWKRAYSFINYKDNFIKNLPAYTLENFGGELALEFYLSNNRYAEFTRVSIYTIYEYNRNTKIQDIYDLKKSFGLVMTRQ